jgi:Glycosyl transferases group 1
MTDYKNPVIVCFQGCPMSNTGNLVRIRAVLEFLVDAGFNVIFYSYIDSGGWPWSTEDKANFRARFPHVSLVLESHTVTIALVQRIKNILSVLSPSRINRIVYTSVPGLTPNWSKLRHQYPNAVYLLNYALNATLLNGVDLSRACIETHDLWFREIALSRSQPIWHLDIMRHMRRELAILDAAGIVLSIARTEQTVLATLLQKPKLCFLPPHFKPQPQTDLEENTKADLLFLGNNNHKNITGINLFLENYRNWHYKPTLAIAGAVSNYAQVDLVSDPGISVLGYVADLTQLYRGIRATICPVQGTGVNMKILEGLSYGKPTFASPDAIAALPPGWEDCVFPLTEASIRNVLDDPARLHAASIAALKYVDSPYIRGLWSDFQRALIDLLEFAVNKPDALILRN